jgi:chromosome segregation ATPase
MKGYEVDVGTLTAHDWSQASRDAKYFGSLFRRMAVLEEISGEGGELKAAVDALEAKKAELTTELAGHQATVDANRKAIADALTKAGVDADKILAEARATKADADRRLAEANDKALSVEAKMSERQKELGEETEKLRRIREEIAEIRKKL